MLLHNSYFVNAFFTSRDSSIAAAPAKGAVLLIDEAEALLSTVAPHGKTGRSTQHAPA